MITSNNNTDYYCINSLRSFRAANKFNSPKNLGKDHDYCYAIMFCFIEVKIVWKIFVKN